MQWLNCVFLWPTTYSTQLEISTQFGFVVFCCGIVSSIYPYLSGLLTWQTGITWHKFYKLFSHKYVSIVPDIFSKFEKKVAHNCNCCQSMTFNSSEWYEGRCGNSIYYTVKEWYYLLSAVIFSQKFFVNLNNIALSLQCNSNIVLRQRNFAESCITQKTALRLLMALDANDWMSSGVRFS